MNSFPNAPRLLRGGVVLLDPVTSLVTRVVALQYNPDSISRTLQLQAVAGDQPDRLEALRLKAPAIETIKLDAEIDATDQLEVDDPIAMQYGIEPQLATLETMLYPSSGQLLANNILAQQGTLEIVPMEAPLPLFIWSATRIVPVRITEFSVTEEAFDQNLNPIRAKVSLGMRVLSVYDLGFDTAGGNIFIAYQQQKERFAAIAQSASLGTLGVGAIP
jgi:hypothetical protein